uniref:ShKT domain-containing protein n=1 Tax=Wuchereria bancrofti TaxID=6293 RepID=A0AAF5RY45_WUCBA
MNLSTYIIIFICIGFIFGTKEIPKKGIKGVINSKHLRKEIPTPKRGKKCKDKWKNCSQMMLYGDCFRFPHYAIRFCAKSCRKCK